MDLFKKAIITTTISDSFLTDQDIRLDILRLDLIHPEISGNKWFKLKYNIQDALDQRHLIARGYAGEGPPPPGLLDDEVRMEAARRYIETYELLTGLPFVPALGDAHPRLQAAVTTLSQGRVS